MDINFSVEIVKGAIVLVSAFLGVHLALQKYKSEKRWESRHAAYQDILRAISDIDAWVEESYASSKLLPGLTGEKLSEQGSRYHAARHSLWRQAKVGSLLLAPSSIGALNDLVTDVEGERIRLDHEPADDSNRDEVLAEHCEKLRAILAKHVPVIVRHAKADLK